MIRFPVPLYRRLVAQGHTIPSASPDGCRLVWIADITGGLAIQKALLRDLILHTPCHGLGYGIVHLASGHRVVSCTYRYRDACACQQELLQLPVDWTSTFTPEELSALYAQVAPIFDRYGPRRLV